jgi:hypothetical protein
MSITKSQSDTGHPSAAFVTLDSIVRKALLDFDGDSMHNYFKFLNYAYYGVQDLNLDIKGNIDDVSIPMRDNRTIQVPPDFMTWIKVGYIQNGVISFIHNSECGVIQEPDTTEDPPINVENIKLDTCCTNGDTRYFKYQDKEATIRFSPDVDLQDVYLRYLATPYQLAGETMIPVQAEQMILWRIKSEYALHNPLMMRLSDKYEKKYNDARKMARGRFNKMTAKDVYNISVRYFGKVIVKVK